MKTMKSLFKILYCLCIILLMLFCTSCNANKDADELTAIDIESIAEDIKEPVQEEETAKPETEKDEFNNVSISTYAPQIFYGEFEISRIIPGGRFTREQLQSLEELIGSIICFSRNEIRFNNVQVVKEVKYSVNLVPIEQRDKFDPYGQPTNYEDVYLENMPYYAYIYIYGETDSQAEQYESWKKCPSNIIVKDKETIILRGENGLLELKRISYPENYDMYV